MSQVILARGKTAISSALNSKLATVVRYIQVFIDEGKVTAVSIDPSDNSSDRIGYIRTREGRNFFDGWNGAPELGLTNFLAESKALRNRR